MMTTILSQSTSTVNSGENSVSGSIPPVDVTSSIEKEILINTQVAIFFDQPIIQPDKVYQKVQTFLPKFNTTPMIVPVPNEPQLYEVPIVQLVSNDRLSSINIARARADFFLSGQGPKGIASRKDRLFEEAPKFLSVFSEFSKIKRVGFVTRFFIKEESQEKVIANLLLESFKEIYKDTDINPTDIYIRYTQKSKIGDVEVNDYVSVEKFSAIISGEANPAKGILITRDFNTNPEKNYSDKINENFLKDFITTASERFKLDKLEEILWPTNRT